MDFCLNKNFKARFLLSFNNNKAQKIQLVAFELESYEKILLVLIFCPLSGYLSSATVRPGDPVLLLMAAQPFSGLSDDGSWTL